MAQTPDWAGQGGDDWARWWRTTDQALAPVGQALDAAVLAAAPTGPFRALDIGCGPGTTAFALATARPDAAIVGCDLSPALVDLARARAPANCEFVLGDARAVAREAAPFDLLFSRHGVMFFDDPVAAFADLRAGAAPGAPLVFTCFADWRANHWACALAEAAAGATVPAPGIAPGGFAFADQDHVAALLAAASWTGARARRFDFDYVAAHGEDAIDTASAYLGALGPAARLIDTLGEDRREAATARLRAAIAGRFDGKRIVFPAAAWLWTARAG